MNDAKDTQKSSLRSAFEVIDADGDGRISYDDLKAFCGGACWGSDEDAIGSMMSVADRNKDGYVEYAEFQKILNGGGGGSRRRLMEEAFRVLDGDGDGKIGLEDLRGYMKLAGFESIDDDDMKAMVRLAGEEEGVPFLGFLRILSL